jgi:hypothetical protein
MASKMRPSNSSFLSYDDTSEDDRGSPVAISSSQLRYSKDLMSTDWKKKFYSMQQQCELFQKTNTDLRNSVK